jgi:hypothetical protein
MNKEGNESEFFPKMREQFFGTIDDIATLPFLLPSKNLPTIFGTSGSGT